jgi:arsenite-transporting ATPase
VEPGPAAEEALRVARFGLSLYGLRTDALVANKVLPAGGSTDPWLAALTAQQRKSLDGWHGDRDVWPTVYELPHLGRAPGSLEDLAELAAPGPSQGPPPPGQGQDSGDASWIEDRLADEGLLVWCLRLPGAAKNEIGLVRKDHELLLTVGPFRRIVPLASALRRCTVSGAALTDGVLRVRFTPDPGLWPEESGAGA